MMRMMRPLTGLVVSVLFSGGCGGGSGSSGAAISRGQASDATTTAEVRAVLDRYVKAVNDADENILRKNNFTQRELKISNVAIQAVGDVAWAVFDWEFSGMQTDGKPSQSHGWETQVYRRTDRGWRISHAHYSVPATPPPTGGQAGQ